MMNVLSGEGFMIVSSHSSKDIKVISAIMKLKLVTLRS